MRKTADYRSSERQWRGSGCAILFLFICNCASLASAEPWITRGVLASLRMTSDGIPIIVQVTFGATKAHFVIDTGSSMTIIDDSLAAGLKQLAEAAIVETARHPIRVSTFQAPGIRIGQMDCNWVRQVGCLDLEFVQNGVGQPIDGILGMDVFKDLVLHLDFDNRLVLVCDPSQISAPLVPRLPLEFDQFSTPVVLVPLTASEQTIFRIDTGLMTTGTLRNKTLVSLRSVKQISPTGMFTELVHGDGDGRKVELGRWEVMELGKNKYRKLVFATGTHDVVGLLFIVRHTVTLDFKAKYVYLQPGSLFDARDRSDYDGLVVDYRNPAHRLIAHVAADSVGERTGFKSGDEIIEVNGVSATKLSRVVLNGILSRPRLAPTFIMIRRNGEYFNLRIK